MNNFDDEKENQSKNDDSLPIPIQLDKDIADELP